MGSLAQMSYMFGVFTGAVVLGSLADKYAQVLILYKTMLSMIEVLQNLILLLFWNFSVVTQ